MSTSEHSGAYSGVSQAAGSYKHARVGSKVTTHISKRRAVISLCATKKVFATVPNKSISYCMLCLTHSSWSKEKAVYC